MHGRRSLMSGMLCSHLMYSVLNLLRRLKMFQMVDLGGCTSILHIGRLVRMSVLDTEVDGSNPGSSMLFP